MEGLSYRSSEELKREVQAWLAAFTPLVMESRTLTESEVMKRVGLIQELRKTGPLLKLRVGDLGFEEEDLANTFRRAVEQLPSLEEDARRQLAALRPGDPRGIPDLDALKERLTTREAVQELGIPPVPAADSEALVEVGSPSQPASAGIQAIVGLGIFAFVTIHMILVIGGMSHIFGGGAFFILFFYMIFYAAGYGMVNTAWKAAAEEKITIAGRKLTIMRSLGFLTTSSEFQLARNTVPRIGMPNNASGLNSNRGQYLPQAMLLLTDERGKEVTFGAGMSYENRIELRDKIDAYLKTHP